MGIDREDGTRAKTAAEGAKMEKAWSLVAAVARRKSRIPLLIQCSEFFKSTAATLPRSCDMQDRRSLKRPSRMCCLEDASPEALQAVATTAREASSVLERSALSPKLSHKPHHRAMVFHVCSGPHCFAKGVYLS